MEADVERIYLEAAALSREEIAQLAARLVEELARPPLLLMTQSPRPGAARKGVRRRRHFRHAAGVARVFSNSE